ncbi:tartrate dehydrogenase [Mycolicibacterium litorale]|uniref:tartrate dehydrogenase n=1 Tax=Mycolicibacterium litorale TaxID=758802 RepID=UPI003CE6A734
MPRTSHRIALIPGDGIGGEVIPPATAVLDTVGRRHGLTFTYDTFDWSCERYAVEGAMMPPDGLDRIRAHDAILLGAVGWPGVPDHVSLWGLLIPIRREFDQYVNMRPISVFDGVQSPLKDALPRGVDGGVDLVIVRENSEGEYSTIGGRFGHGEGEFALQESVFTRAGIRRIAEFGFSLAEERRGRLVAATKSNGIVHTMPFWDEVVSESAAAHPGVTWHLEHIDALAAKMVLHPGDFDVVLGSNLFGDILSDLAAAVAGSIGIAPSANLNPSGEWPSMFEPVHGSAPDIAGRGVANPLGAIWSASMMLDHLGHREAGAEVLEAIRASVRDGHLTRDLGGTASTAEMTHAVLDRLGEH